MAKASPIWQKRLFFIGKITLSFTALYIVYRKVDITNLLNLLREGEWIWYLPALVCFTLSQFVSALRLNTLFRQIGLTLSEWANLRLYWLGMYYNLLLPGGIGGDAYKLVTLRRRDGVRTRDLVLASLSDRAFGLLALILLGLILLFFYPQNLPGVTWIPGLLPLMIILAWGLVRGIQPVLLPVFSKVLGWSFLVQGLQVGSVVFLLLMIGQPTPWLGFLILFLASSVLAALPLSYGGAGAREIAFLYGATWLGLAEAPAVVISVLFYSMTLLVSLSGMLFSFRHWDESSSRKPAAT